MHNITEAFVLNVSKAKRGHGRNSPPLALMVTPKLPHLKYDCYFFIQISACVA